MKGWLVVLFTAALVSAADGQGELHIRLASPESLRKVYEEMGFVFDDAASEAQREKWAKECLVKGSRRYGHVPRPIRFLGLAYNVADEKKELRPFCMAIRPASDKMARRICEMLGRPFVANRMMNMEVVCGAKRP